MAINWGFVTIFLLSGTTAVFGNMLLKAGMNSLGGFEIEAKTLLATILRFATSWQIVIGVGFYVFSLFLYLKLLSLGELTRIYPAVVSYMFIMLLIFGGLFLKESVTFTKVLGIAIIVLGIFLASR